MKSAGDRGDGDRFASDRRRHQEHRGEHQFRRHQPQRIDRPRQPEGVDADERLVVHEPRHDQREHHQIDHGDEHGEVVHGQLKAQVAERGGGAGGRHDHAAGDDQDPRHERPPQTPQIFPEDVPRLAHDRALRRSRAMATNISRSVIGKTSTRVAANTAPARRSVSPST